MANGFFWRAVLLHCRKILFSAHQEMCPPVLSTFGWLGSCSTVINTIEAVNFKSSVEVSCLGFNAKILADKVKKLRVVWHK
jgi:hypothetical protein